MTFRLNRYRGLINLSLEQAGGGFSLSGPYTIVPGVRQINVSITSGSATGLAKDFVKIKQSTKQVTIKGLADGTVLLELKPVTIFRLGFATHQTVSLERFQ
jgi:hypothetical protein